MQDGSVKVIPWAMRIKKMVLLYSSLECTEKYKKKKKGNKNSKMFPENEEKSEQIQ